MKNEYADVALDQIELSTTNTMFRDPADFTPAALQDLVDSIKKSGVLSPILLRKGKKKKYELVCGERRYRASQEAKLTLIPASIRDLKDDEALEAQVVENLQRENINPMKEAAAFEWMTKNKKLTAAAIADRIGKSADYVQERIKLTTLIKDAQEFVRTGVLPLKAGLKIARIPEQLQKKVLSESITTVSGLKGTSYTFVGMSNLQRQLERYAFNELSKADFDTEDAKLVPSAGPCALCPKRTKNTGGLFDDISKGDHCLDAGCFKLKQTATYVALKDQLNKKHPDIEIIFKPRTSSANQDFPKLKPMLEYYGRHEMREISATDVDKVKDKKHLKLAINVGTSHYGEDKKKTVWVTSEKIKSSSSGSGGASKSPAQKAADQKLRDERLKTQRIRAIETQLTTEQFMKKTTVLKPEFLKQAVIAAADGYDMESDEVMTAFKALGIDWVMEKRAGTKTTKIQIKAKDADLPALISDDTLRLVNEKEVIEKLPADKINAMFAWSIYCRGYGLQKQMVASLKIDTKSINAKAKAMTATWWKEEQLKRKQKTPTKKK